MEHKRWEDRPAEVAEQGRPRGRSTLLPRKPVSLLQAQGFGHTSPPTLSGTWTYVRTCTQHTIREPGVPHQSTPGVDSESWGQPWASTGGS